MDGRLEPAMGMFTRHRKFQGFSTRTTLCDDPHLNCTGTAHICGADATQGGRDVTLTVFEVAASSRHPLALAMLYPFESPVVSKGEQAHFNTEGSPKSNEVLRCPKKNELNVPVTPIRQHACVCAKSRSFVPTAANTEVAMDVWRLTSK